MLGGFRANNFELPNKKEAWNNNPIKATILDRIKEKRQMKN